ncbi:MAG: histidine kinase, partial [Chitinophagaceae bacterium]
RLKGLSNEWLNGNSQFINFTGLPSGNFSLEVKAIDGFLQNNNVQTIIQFTVTRPFYKTIWFIIICISMVAGFIYHYYRNKLLRILSLQSLRNNISRDLHDEVGSTLSSVSILSTSVLQQIDKEPQKAKEWIQQIGINARQMLDVMDEIVWTINPKMDSLETIVQRLKEFGYNATEAADIELTFYLADKLKNVLLPMLSKRNAYLIMKEAINNAIKHANCKHIKVHISKKESQIQMIVEDDGVGFDISLKTNRNGLKNMQSRAAEMKGDIAIESVPDCGTKIFFTFNV